MATKIKQITNYKGRYCAELEKRLVRFVQWLYGSSALRESR